MTTECTVRFNGGIGPNNETEIQSLVDGFNLDVKGRLIGGFYFTTPMTPIEILEMFEGEGFSFSDFENIEFKPC